MKKETLQSWLMQIESMVTTLDTAAKVNGLNAEERHALVSLKNAVDSFEASIEEREKGIRIPSGYSVSSTLNRRV